MQKAYCRIKYFDTAKFVAKKFFAIYSFSLKKALLIPKNGLSLPHAPAGSKVRMICRGVQPGA